MDDVKNMLKVVINGQKRLERDLELLKLETREGFRETRENFKEVHKRTDKLGSQLAYLEEDAPTREEHGKLEKRVKKVEQVLST